MWGLCVNFLCGPVGGLYAGKAEQTLPSVNGWLVADARLRDDNYCGPQGSSL